MFDIKNCILTLRKNYMNLEEKQDLIEFYIKCEQLSDETKYYLLYDIIWK